MAPTHTQLSAIAAAHNAGAIGLAALVLWATSTPWLAGAVPAYHSAPMQLDSAPHLVSGGTVFHFDPVNAGLRAAAVASGAAR